MQQVKTLLLLSLILIFNLSAFSQTNSDAYQILHKTFTKYKSLDTISFSTHFVIQNLNTHGNWDNVYTKNNRFTAIQNADKQWYPVLASSRDKDNITEFYRFRNALIRSKWAVEHNKVRLYKSCGKSPVYMLEYWDVPLRITGGGDSLLRQSIYIDTLSHLIVSVQTVKGLEESNISLSSLILDSIDTHKKVIIPDVFQLNNGMLKPGDKAPVFLLKNTEDQQVSLANYKGKLLMLDFWYAACKPCIKASADLEYLQKKYHNKLVVLGMNTLDNASKIKRHNKKHHITYESLLCSRDTKKAYHVRSFPSFYLINEDGLIVYSSSGYYEGLRKDLELAILQSIHNR